MNAVITARRGGSHRKSSITQGTQPNSVIGTRIVMQSVSTGPRERRDGRQRSTTEAYKSSVISAIAVGW